MFKYPCAKARDQGENYRSSSSSSETSEYESDLFSERTNSTRPTVSSGSRHYEDASLSAPSREPRCRSSEPHTSEPTHPFQRRSPSPRPSAHPERSVNDDHYKIPRPRRRRHEEPYAEPRERFRDSLHDRGSYYPPASNPLPRRHRPDYNYTDPLIHSSEFPPAQ